MAQYGMGDEATIDEIIDDVDTDKVSYLLLIPKEIDKEIRGFPLLKR